MDEDTVDMDIGKGVLDVVSVLAATAGPPGVAVAATIQGGKAILDIVRSHRERQVRAFLTRLSELEPEFDQCVGQPAAEALLACALDHAARSQTRLHAEAMAHLVADGLADSENCDDAQVLIKVLEDLTLTELRAVPLLLAHRLSPEMKSDRRGITADPAQVLIAECGMLPPSAHASVGRLRAAGIIIDVGTYGGSVPGVSELGERLVEVLPDLAQR